MANKGDKKKRSMGMRLALGALATAGAVGFVRGGKKWVKSKIKKIKGAFGGKKAADTTSVDG